MKGKRGTFIKGDQASWRRCHQGKGLGGARLLSRKVVPEQRLAQVTAGVSLVSLGASGRLVCLEQDWGGKRRRSEIHG